MMYAHCSKIKQGKSILFAVKRKQELDAAAKDKAISSIVGGLSGFFGGAPKKEDDYDLAEIDEPDLPRRPAEGFKPSGGIGIFGFPSKSQPQPETNKFPFKVITRDDVRQQQAAGEGHSSVGPDWGVSTDPGLESTTELDTNAWSTESLENSGDTTVDERSSGGSDGAVYQSDESSVADYRYSSWSDMTEDNELSSTSGTMRESTVQQAQNGTYDSLDYPADGASSPDERSFVTWENTAPLSSAFESALSEDSVDYLFNSTAVYSMNDGIIIGGNFNSFLNESINGNFSSSVLASPSPEDFDYDGSKTTPYFFILKDLLPDDKPLTDFINKFYGQYEFIAEAYIMSSFAALGILANILAIVALSRDRRILRTSRTIHNIFFVCEMLFLAVAIAFLQIRTHAGAWIGHKGSVERLEIANYFTSLFGVMQTISTWLLYVTATEVHRAVRQLIDPKDESCMSKYGTVRNTLTIVFISLTYFIAYLPPVRYHIFKLITGELDGFHKLCNVPLESHWDFDLTEVPNTDLFYILYYSLCYILLDYVLPFILICCRDKDIIDVLHRAQKQPDLVKNAAHILCPALAVSVMCNIYLVCIALKMVILTFKIFEFAAPFVAGAVMFFQYLNVYSNFLQLVKSSLHLGIIMLYNDRLRSIIIGPFLEKREKSRRRRKRIQQARAAQQLRRQSTVTRSQTITTVV